MNARGIAGFKLVMSLAVIVVLAWKEKISFWMAPSLVQEFNGGRTPYALWKDTDLFHAGRF